MAVSPVEIDLTAEIAALPQETFTDVALIGTAETAPPEAEFGEVNRYTGAAEVSEDYGEGSDVHEGAQAVAEMGAGEFYVLVLEETHVEAESVTDGGTLDNTPALGSVGVDAPGYTTVYTTGLPEEEDPAEDELVVNMDTGEVATGDGASADVDYAYVSWSDGLVALEDHGINRAHLAGIRADRRHIGDYDSFVSWATAADVGVPLAIEDPRTYESWDEAKAVAHDVAGYVPAGNVLGVTAAASGDIGAYKLGQMAVNDPWHNPFFDGDGYPYGIDSIPSRHIGEPGVEGTFLGGDESESGPVNVVVSIGGTNVLWKSSSTAGAASDYQYFDVKMTEIFAGSVVENALTSLRLREDRIPFTDDGKTMISSTIKSALADYTGGPNDPFAEIDVHVPSFDDLTQDDRANRRWSGIKIEGRLSGDTHTFGVEMTVTV